MTQERMEKLVLLDPEVSQEHQDHLGSKDPRGTEGRGTRAAVAPQVHLAPQDPGLETTLRLWIWKALGFLIWTS